jgi:biotin-[acetyl-CoA-carboxylase] ligase BirA-like protein
MDDQWPEGAVVSMGQLQVRLVGELRSTQEELWSKRTWLQPGAGIAARFQTAGVGRGGAAWRSPEGGVYLSVLVGRGLPAAEADLLGEAAALAVLRTARELLPGEKVFLKWPNDVITWGPRRTIGKLAGVLSRTEIEGERVERAAVGIGLNVRAVVEEEPLGTEGVSAASLEGMAGRARVPWTASRSKVLEWLVGWFSVELGRAAKEPDALRREFSREIAKAPLRAKVAGVHEELRPLGAERGGALVVRRLSGKRATVAVEDAERLVWSIVPRKAPASGKARGSTGRGGASRPGPARSSRGRNAPRARQSPRKRKSSRRR